jgi:hypothetical protein
MQRFTIVPILILILVCVILGFPAASQEPPSIVVNPAARDIGAEDLKAFCIFNDRLYSVGAFLCAAKRVSLQCERPDKDARAAWKMVTNPDCEPNQSLTPP